MKNYLQYFKPTDLIIIIMMSYAIWQNFQLGTKEEIQTAQQSATEAKQLIKAQAEEIQKLKQFNQDILGVVEGMAKNNNVAKAKIEVLELTYDIKADSSDQKISKAKKALDELFRETFKKLQK